MAPNRTSKREVGLGWAVMGLLCLILGVQQTGYPMGWLEKRVKEREGRFWRDVDAAKPLIKRNADYRLQQLGYDTEKLAFAVFLGGEAEDEAWVVKYWDSPPKDYVTTAAKHADLEVYLNNRGIVKRIIKFEQGRGNLIYGKDERIEYGMTPDQVRERLGEPDYVGPPPHYLQKDNKFDVMWRYKATVDRMVRIEILFKDSKVTSVASFGEVPRRK